LPFELKGGFHCIFIQRIQHHWNITPHEGLGVGIDFYIAGFFWIRDRFGTNDNI
jgi:hypothetical protein